MIASDCSRTAGKIDSEFPAGNFVSGAKLGTKMSFVKRLRFAQMVTCLLLLLGSSELHRSFFCKKMMALYMCGIVSSFVM